MTEPSKTPVPAAKPVQKHHLFSLRVKFILVLTFLICVVMGVVTWLILSQLQQTLTQQVISRGEAQVRGLASNSVDPLSNILSRAATQQGGLGEDIDLNFIQSAKDAMEV